MKTRKTLLSFALTLVVVLFLISDLSWGGSTSSVVSNTSVSTLVITGDDGNNNDRKTFIQPGSHPFPTPVPAPVGLPAKPAWNESSMEKSIFALKQKWTIRELMIIAEIKSNDSTSPKPWYKRSTLAGDQDSDIEKSAEDRSKEIEFTFRTYKPWGLSYQSGNIKIQDMGSREVYVLLSKLPKKVVAFEDSLNVNGKKTYIAGESTATAYTTLDEIVARIILRFFTKNADIEGVIVSRYGFEKEQHSDSDTKDFSPTISIGGVNLAGAGLGGIASSSQTLKRKSLAYAQVYAFTIIGNELGSTPVTERSETDAETGQMQKMLRELAEENQRLTEQLTAQSNTKIELVPNGIKFYFNRYIPVTGQDKELASMAGWFVLNWDKISAVGDPALVGHADERPTGLSVRKDRINPWIALQRAMMVKVLLEPELRALGLKKNQIDQIRILSASNLSQLRPNAKTNDEHQENRQVFAVVISGIRGK